MIKNQLKNKIFNNTATISIVGLGYVGLPVAIAYVNAGYNVIGIEKSLSKTNLLDKGKSYIEDIKDEDILKLKNSNRFKPTTDFSCLSASDIIIICVPTPLTSKHEPDVTCITNVVEQIKKFMRKSTLIILESTVYPGATEELIEQELNKSLYKEGEDFFLCFSSERVDPGNKVNNIKNTPKVIGGITESSLELGILLYSKVVEKVVPVKSPKIAEMSKLIENTYRSVNIAFINEMTLLCEKMGINIWEVIDAAATKPFGFMAFYPGPGIGGHCIPLDPIYLDWKAKQFNFISKFIQLAHEVNKHMPRYVANKVLSLLNTKNTNISNFKILILGLAYKRDVNDIRESPSLIVYHNLIESGVSVDYSDPYVEYFEDANNQKIYSVNIEDKILTNYDCVVLLTDHTSFDYDLIANYSKLILDTKNIFKDQIKKNNIVTLGDEKLSYDGTDFSIYSEVAVGLETML